eukprot:UN27503
MNQDSTTNNNQIPGHIQLLHNYHHFDITQYIHHILHDPIHNNPNQHLVHNRSKNMKHGYIQNRLVQHKRSHQNTLDLVTLNKTLHYLVCNL